MEDKVFLLPGEMIFVREPTRVSTLLGSCVALCLHDRRRKWGGMNHFMLPYQRESHLDAAKCGDYAIHRLIALARGAGSRKADLVASIYGGGNVTGHLGSADDIAGLDIGAKNAEVARVVLRSYAIEVVGQETGGRTGRKVCMNTATNEIEVREITPTEQVPGRCKDRQEFMRPKIRFVRTILRAGIAR